jgi:hypothetical protein
MSILFSKAKWVLMMGTYSGDVVLDDSGDGLGMLNVLFGDHGQVGDLVSVVGDEVFERAFVVFCDFI